ncbi:MAG: hypothetical protein QOF02_271 [Blastocatellia bacterium]|jgi:hypothetical protein|nr:hypothetical protein [Blastocatellia bacterium]
MKVLSLCFNEQDEQRLIGKMSHLRHLTSLGFALALCVCALVGVASGQEARQRSARSLTSEDLLDRRAAYVAPASAAGIAPSPNSQATAASAFYRDPSGAFVLNFPNRSWRVNAKGAHGGRLDTARSFRKVEEEGFASATANVYVLEGGGASSALAEVARLSPEQQQNFASLLATRFLSSNSSLVSVEQIFGGAGLRVVADQVVARRAVVRAVINAFERRGRLYVVVCSAPSESFEINWREFNDITASLASSVMRS